MHSVLFSERYLSVCARNMKKLGCLEMAQKVKTLTIKSEDLSSSPGTHVMEWENWLTQVVLCPLHTCHSVCRKKQGKRTKCGPRKRGQERKKEISRIREMGKCMTSARKPRARSNHVTLTQNQRLQWKMLSHHVLQECYKKHSKTRREAKQANRYSLQENQRAEKEMSSENTVQFISEMDL